MTMIQKGIALWRRYEEKSWWIFVLAYGLIAAYFIFQPLERLVTTVLIDDAFYYFRVAKHLAQGLGSTFDGLAPTNGYHPIWMMILIPLFYLIPQDLYAIQMALVASAVLYAAAAWFIYRAFQDLIPEKWVRSLLYAAWFLNPLLIVESINGLETSLSIFCLSLFVWMLTKWRSGATSLFLLSLGAVGGIMLLSRTDFIIYFLILTGYQLFLRKKTFWKDGFRIALGAGAILLPWLLWNLFTFGTVVQVSGSAFSLAQYQRVFVSSTVNVGRPWLFVFLKASFSTTIYGLEALFHQGLYPWLVFLCMGICLAAYLFKPTGSSQEEAASNDTNSVPRQEAWRTILPSLLLAGVIYFIAQASVRWAIRSWYFAHLQILVWVGIAYAYHRASAFRVVSRIRMRWILPVAVLMMCSWVWVGYKDATSRYANQEEFIQAADWMNQHLPAGSRIGVFNSGIQGFFSIHEVVNLDGLVNNAVYPYLKERDLLTYIREQKIGYISDFYKVIFGKFGPSWGADPYIFFTKGEAITTLKMFDPKGIYLYKISEQGQESASTSTRP